MKIGIVQMRASNSKEENLLRADRYVEQAVKSGAEIVALPEMFSCPMVHKYYREFAEPKGGKVYSALSDMAKRHGVILIGGSSPELAGAAAGGGGKEPKIFNTSWTFDSNGNEIYEYRKRRLFDISLRDGREFKESKTFQSGAKAPSSFDTPFGRVGLAICFELRFVTDFVEIEQSGAKVCFVPANFSIPTGQAHWELLFRARALDSQFFVVGVSSARDPESKFMSYGHSIVTDPWGDVLWQAGEEECVGVVSIDLDEVDKRREELPVASSRSRSES